MNVRYLVMVTRDHTWKRELCEHDSPSPGYASNHREHTVWPVLHVKAKNQGGALGRQGIVLWRQKGSL